MTAKARSSGSKSAGRSRPKLKRETLKDLGGARGKGVKGGWKPLVTDGCQGGNTLECGGGTGTGGGGGATGLVTCACVRR